MPSEIWKRLRKSCYKKATSDSSLRGLQSTYNQYTLFCETHNQIYYWKTTTKEPKKVNYSLLKQNIKLNISSISYLAPQGQSWANDTEPRSPHNHRAS